MEKLFENEYDYIEEITVTNFSHLIKLQEKSTKECNFN